MEGEGKIINFEETELRLGLPGGGGGIKMNSNEFEFEEEEFEEEEFEEEEEEEEIINDDNYCATNANGKREFIQTVDLKLNLASSEDTLNLLHSSSPANPPPKAQVVGWPPVRSFRKTRLVAKKSRSVNEEIMVMVVQGASLVKVSMDGEPYLRKVDLRMYKTYQHLIHSLATLFTSFTIGKCENEGMEWMNERKVMDPLSACDYVSTYEDRDGDWMLLGDVPWEMFVDSCKRIRMMKRAEAIGLAPRAMDKCKNKS